MVESPFVSIAHRNAAAHPSYQKQADVAVNLHPTTTSRSRRVLARMSSTTRRSRLTVTRHLVLFHAEAGYQPLPSATAQRRNFGAELELRDYPSLMEAVRNLDVEVCLAGASPWPERRSEASDRTFPLDVSARVYSPNLYASSWGSRSL